MEYTYQIFPEKKLVVERITGELTLEGLIEKTNTVFGDPAYDKSYAGAIDLRDAKVRISKVELYGFAKYINDSEHFGQARWAALGLNPLVVAFSQIFKLRIKNSHLIGIFSTTSAAARFLEQPDLEDYLDD